MIKKYIGKTFNDQMHALECMKDLMELEAIKDDGIYSTFKFNTQLLPTISLTKANLHYCKLDCDDKWLPAQRKIFYKTCPELGDVTFPYISPETMQKVTDRIKMDMVKKDNAIWSTIKFEPSYNRFDVSYEKVLAGNYSEDPHLTTSRYLGASDLEIENTKKTLRRIQENSYYGLYPRHAGLTCHFDEKLKEDIKASLEGKWKPKATPWCGFSPANVINNEAVKYAEADVKATKEAFEFIHKKEEKENDMKITLMVVPEGMSKDFVRKVKADYQSNNSLRLFIASTDIVYSCEHEPIKTKYDLFEKWIKTGYVDVVYFMLGFEKDPDVRAFEAFVRGVTETEVPGKVDIRVVYQKDDILNDVNNLRTAYFDEADAEEDLENAGNNVVRKAKVMKEVYSLDNAGLDIIKYSKGKIDASDELVINDIMDVAFAEDEDAKPAKKGGKGKND